MPARPRQRSVGAHPRDLRSSTHAHHPCQSATTPTTLCSAHNPRIAPEVGADLKDHLELFLSGHATNFLHEASSWCRWRRHRGMCRRCQSEARPSCASTTRLTARCARCPPALLLARLRARR
jgi:hypothetical protein